MRFVFSQKRIEPTSQFSVEFQQQSQRAEPGAKRPTQKGVERDQNCGGDQQRGVESKTRQHHFERGEWIGEEHHAE